MTMINIFFTLLPVEIDIMDALSLLRSRVVGEPGVAMSFLARRFGLSIPPVSLSATQGRRIAETKGILLL